MIYSSAFERRLIGEIIPFPGGEEAREMGCSCPTQSISDVVTEGMIQFDSECPVQHSSPKPVTPEEPPS